jgi:hypothetical protein
LVRLRGYRGQTGQSLLVFFDSGDLPGRLRNLSTTGVQVRFAAPGQTADDAIIGFLGDRQQPGQYTVVTNDQALAHRARLAGASVQRASDFAARMAPRTAASPPAAVPEPDPHDPAYADLYAGFMAAQRASARQVDRPAVDLATWTERLYSGDPQLAQRAAEWLGQFGGAAALEPLTDALTHRDPAVRAAAVLALGALGDPAPSAALIERLQDDGNSMVREAAAQSLGQIGARAAEGALALAAKDDTKGKVRKAARAALEQIRARRG